jgi:gliding motility-associated-like protein
VKSTNNNGLSFEKAFTISIKNVSEKPALGVINDISLCGTDPGTIPVEGISGGGMTGQPYTLAVKSDNALFDDLSITPGKEGQATIHYSLKPDAKGVSHITVTVTNNGDKNSSSQVFTLTVNPLPVVTITGDTDQVSKGDIVQLQASGGATYQWDAAEGIISGQNDAILAVRAMAKATYHVTAYSAAGCSAGKDATVTIQDDYKMQAANILTPNGDGRNDTWVIKNIDSYPNNEVSIFDRSGRMIYHKKGYGNDWNGTVNGRPLHEGTYYYVIDFGNGKKIIKGYISIVTSGY